MLELFKIAGKIELDGAEQADKKLDQIDKKGKGLGSRIGKTAKKFGKGMAIIGGAATAAGVASFAMVNKVTSGLDDIAKGAEKVGVSSGAYQEMSYWAGQNGIEHRQMEKIVGRFNQRMGKAKNGNEKYSEALQQMGIDMDEVRKGTVSTEDAFAQSIKSLSEMESEQDKVNLATEMFGDKASRDLLPALNDGSLSLEEAAKKAKELGIVMDEDALAASEKFQDTWDDLTKTLGMVGQKIAVELMPYFQNMMDWILENLPAIKEKFSVVFDAVKGVFTTVIDTIKGVIEWFNTWYESNEETVNGIWLTIQEKFQMVKEFIEEIWGTIKEFWQENGEEILNNAIRVFTSIKDTVQTYITRAQEIIEEVLNLVVPFIQEQLAKVEKFWDENGDKIMQAVENAFSFIETTINAVMDTIEWIIDNVWDNIAGIIDSAVNIVMDTIDLFASLLTGDFEGVRDAVLDIWDELWNIIKEVVEGAWDLLSGAFGILWDSISGWFTDLGSDAKEWGSDIVTGLWQGIKDMGSWLKTKVGDFISDNIPGPVKKILGISSPSKLMKEYGEDTGEGLGIGIEKKERDLKRTSERMAQTVARGMTPQVEIGQRAMSQPQQSSNSTTHNNYEAMFRGMFDGATFNTENKEDIEVLAQKLGRYVKDSMRSKGVVVR